jgi:hypothetical protein
VVRSWLAIPAAIATRPQNRDLLCAGATLCSCDDGAIVHDFLWPVIAATITRDKEHAANTPRPADIKVSTNTNVHCSRLRGSAEMRLPEFCVSHSCDQVRATMISLKEFIYDQIQKSCMYRRCVVLSHDWRLCRSELRCRGLFPASRAGAFCGGQRRNQRNPPLSH